MCFSLTFVALFVLHLLVCRIRDNMASAELHLLPPKVKMVVFPESSGKDAHSLERKLLKSLCVRSEMLTMTLGFGSDVSTTTH